MEKLSEQLAISDRLGAVSTSNGSTVATGTGLDMAEHHNAIAYGIVDWTTTAGTTNVTAALAIQASTSSGFTGTPTTIASASVALPSVTTTGSTEFSVSAIGEDIQAARADEDRYVRATLTLTSGAASHTVTGSGLVLRDRARFKPA